MAFEIKVIDNFITECKASGKEISYENFSPINESLNSDVQIPVEIFEAYLKYVDISGTDMVSIMEFEKIKSFSEFVNDKKSGGESVSDDDDDDDEDEESPEGGEEGSEGGEEKPEGEESPEGGEEKPEGEESPEGGEEKPEGEEDEEDKDGAPNMDIKVETASVGMETDEEGEKKKVEEAAKAIETHPEKVAAQSAEKKDDESHQTKIDLETGDGSKTAGKIEDTINKLGEPEKKSDKEGEALVGEAAARVDVQPEDVKSAKGEKDDKEAGVQVSAETGDGSKTAGKIEDTINKLGEPEKKNEKEGEKLIGESEQEKKNSEVNDIDSEEELSEEELISMDEANQLVESMLLSLNEDFADTVKAAVGSPVKFIKIKNNLKKWAKSKLDIAAVEMDAIRKKEAAKDNPEGVDKEKLATATKAKREAIKGKMDAIEDRLNQLSTTDSLRAIVRLGKTKASLEANQKLLKIAQGEENDALRLKLEDQIEQEKDTITTIQDELKKYSKESDKRDAEAGKQEEKQPEDNKETSTKSSEKPKKSKKEDVKEEPKDKEESEEDSDKNLTKSQKHKKEEIQKLESEIPKMEEDLKARQEGYQETVNNWKEAEKNLKAAKDSGDKEKEDEAQAKYTELASAKQQEESQIAGIEAKIKANKDKISDLKSELPESVEIKDSNSVNENLSNDIAARFREAMSKMK